LGSFSPLASRRRESQNLLVICNKLEASENEDSSTLFYCASKPQKWEDQERWPLPVILLAYFAAVFLGVFGSLVVALASSGKSGPALPSG